MRKVSSRYRIGLGVVIAGLTLALGGMILPRDLTDSLRAQGEPFEMHAIYDPPRDLTTVVSDAIGYGVTISGYAVAWSISGATASTTPTVWISIDPPYDGTNGNLMDIREEYWLTRFDVLDNKQTTYSQLPTTSTLRADWTEQLAAEATELSVYEGCVESHTCPDLPVSELGVIGTVEQLRTLPDSSYVSRVEFSNGRFLPSGLYEIENEFDLPTSARETKRLFAGFSELLKPNALYASRIPVNSGRAVARIESARHGSIALDSKGTSWSPIEIALSATRATTYISEGPTNPLSDTMRGFSLAFNWPFYATKVYKYAGTMDPPTRFGFEIKTLFSKEDDIYDDGTWMDSVDRSPPVCKASSPTLIICWFDTRYKVMSYRRSFCDLPDCYVDTTWRDGSTWASHSFGTASEKLIQTGKVYHISAFQNPGEINGTGGGDFDRGCLYTALKCDQLIPDWAGRPWAKNWNNHVTEPIEEAQCSDGGGKIHPIPPNIGFVDGLIESFYGYWLDEVFHQHCPGLFTTP